MVSRSVTTSLFRGPQDWKKNAEDVWRKPREPSNPMVSLTTCYKWCCYWNAWERCTCLGTLSIWDQILILYINNYIFLHPLEFLFINYWCIYFSFKIFNIIVAYFLLDPQRILNTCESCLIQNKDFLHPLNLSCVKILDCLFDASVDLQLWDKALVYGSETLPAYRYLCIITNLVAFNH